MEEASDTTAIPMVGAERITSEQARVFDQKYNAPAGGPEATEVAIAIEPLEIISHPPASAPPASSMPSRAPHLSSIPMQETASPSRYTLPTTTTQRIKERSNESSNTLLPCIGVIAVIGVIIIFVVVFSAHDDRRYASSSPPPPTPRPPPYPTKAPVPFVFQGSVDGYLDYSLFDQLGLPGQASGIWGDAPIQSSNDCQRHCSFARTFVYFPRETTGVNCICYGSLPHCNVSGGNWGTNGGSVFSKDTIPNCGTP